jgi:uncharacterized protein
MKPSIGIAAAAALALLVGSGALLIIDPFDPTVVDPETARCDQPLPTFGPLRDLAGHREVDVRYPCVGAVQAATIYLPRSAGRHPALVWVHGAGEARRIPFDFGMFRQLVSSGVAVLTYDKRGTGESEGVCCPGDLGHFNLLTADVVGAINVLRARPDIDATQIGLFGASQAGWIAPRAAVDGGAAIVAMAGAPTVTERTANLYERLTAGENGALSRAEISRRLADAHASGFDPLPDLRRLTIPTLWEFGTADVHTPVEESVEILETLKAGGKDITIAVYPGAGHGLLDTPPSSPAASPTMVRWIMDHFDPPG